MHIFGRALRDRRTALLWWTLGIAIYCAFIVAVWPVIDGNDEFQDLYDEMPDTLQAMFGADGFSDFTSPAGFLNTYLFSMILPFIFTGLAVSLGASLIAGEEEDELLDLVLSYPVSRHRLVLEKIAAMFVAVAAIGVATVILLTVAREPVSLDIGVAGLGAATLGSVLFALVYGLVALLTGAWRGSKGAAAGAGWGIALAGYLVNILSSIDESLEWLQSFSPLYWATADSPVTGTLPATYFALVASSVVLAGATVLVFDRHDLS